jgi:methylated-DNA-[protein]-cysteine S-methyltransferase
MKPPNTLNQQHAGTRFLMNHPNSLSHSIIQTPLGEMVIWASSQHLIGAWFTDQPNLNPQALQSPLVSGQGVHREADLWLKNYFAKRTPNPNDLPMQIGQATPLQRITWQALKDIPSGEKISYSELALKIGRPNCARSVASAVAKNPLLIFLPCHRVVGSDGTLRGYSAGLHRKQSLLSIELKD